MVKHMLWGAVAFWWLQAFGLVVGAETGLLAYEQNQVITKLLAVELLTAMGIGVLVVIGILAWLGWDIFVRPGLARLVAWLAIIIACVAFATQASADLLLPVRVEVTQATADSITAVRDTMEYRFHKSLLGLYAASGDSLEVLTSMADGCVREAWQVVPYVLKRGKDIFGAISPNYVSFSQAANLPASITISVESAAIGHRRYKVSTTKEQLVEYAPGDTARVAVWYGTLERAKDGQRLTKTDYERYMTLLQLPIKRE